MIKNDKKVGRKFLEKFFIYNDQVLFCRDKVLIQNKKVLTQYKKVYVLI